MESRDPFPPRPDLQEIEWEMRRPHWDLTAGRLTFDLLFGIAAPAALFLSNEGVFTAPLGERPALPSYCADLTYITAGALLAGLLLWLLTGARRPVLGILMAGPFAVGALLSVLFGVRLFEFAYVHVAGIQGLLGFAPWLAAYVFARHALRAVRTGADLSPGFAAAALVVSAALLLVLLGGLAATADRKAADLELRLFSTDPADQADAIERVDRTRAVDFDRIANHYATESKRPGPHLQKVASSYLRWTGMEIADVAERHLHPIARRPAKPEPKPESPEDKLARLFGGLFSENSGEAAKAADQLLVLQEVNYEPVVRRYGRLRDDDPVKARIKEIFPSLAGQTIESAAKSLAERDKREAHREPPALP